jgi:hypothetical protein
MSKKKKRRKETFITLSSTRIKVTSFSNLIHGDEEQT